MSGSAPIPNRRVTRSMAKKMADPSAESNPEPSSCDPVQRVVNTVKRIKKKITEKKLEKEEIPKPCAPPATPKTIFIRDHRKKIEEKKALANKLYTEQSYKRALDVYSEIIYWSPKTSDSAVLYGNRSACYMMLSRFSDAIKEAKKSLKLNPKFIQGFRRLIKCYLQVGDLPNAELAMESFERLDLSKESVSAELSQAWTLKTSLVESEKAYELKDYQKVVDCMSRCRDISPACVRFKVLQAECLANLEKYTEAKLCADDILKTDKRNVDAIYVRAFCLYYQDEIDQAFTDFQEVLLLVPDHKKALETYDRARLLYLRKAEANAAFGAGDYRKAWNLYEEALLIDPKYIIVNAKLFFNKALVAFKMGKIVDCIGQCSEAIKLDENYLKAILRRAKCYMEVKEVDLAVCDLERAFKLDQSEEIEDLLKEARKEQKRISEEQKLKKKDYYKILGIDKSASTQDVIKAYRKKALEHHPDRHYYATAEEKKVQEKKFKEVGEAHSVLSDPVKRARYDSRA